jgi:hypothetical protein
MRPKKEFAELLFHNRGLGRVGHSFGHVVYFVFLRDVWIRTQRAAVASRRATNMVGYVGRWMAKTGRCMAK